MRRVRRALIVAVAAAIVLAVGARAESRAETPAPQASPSEVSLRAATVAQPPTLLAQVVKPFGAAIRAVPSSEASTMFNTRCGDIWPVLEVERGWVKVRTDTGPGWIGGSRVIVSSSPPTVDCSEARFITPANYAFTLVPSGCLSLRSRPSADAPMLSCVESGHGYAVLDGPFDPGSGDDWFKVSSPETGSGWALAEHLYPI